MKIIDVQDGALVPGAAETPEPGLGEIRVKVVAAGVNRADVLQRKGFYPPPPGISEVIGLEVSGTVDSLGPEAEGWAVGEECVALLAGGGYAEYAVVPAGQAVPPPKGVDLVTSAGLLEVAATVMSNFSHARLASGETVLLHGGAGGIGTFAIQYAKALGARVITTAGTPEKLAFCRELGADEAVDYHDDWAARVNKLTGGRGVDVILDIMGAKYLEANVASLADDGRLVVIGLQGGRKGTLDLNRLLTKRATVTATSLRFRPVAGKVEICQRVAREIWPLVESGAIKPAPTTTYPFDEAAAAHAQLESGDNVGRIVLVL
ncbi:MAG: NAD(P)H-quinone oxidoreductase [Propionibacteriaceae bacterium]|jgi:putative PIG3 family NAD(P)H quinone oxidoreductase|nr:NAD(P)H-quinone oxidoreductase [Propionibacteriaceae bacterium]